MCACSASPDALQDDLSGAADRDAIQQLRHFDEHEAAKGRGGNQLLRFGQRDFGAGISRLGDDALVDQHVDFARFIDIDLYIVGRLARAAIDIEEGTSDGFHHQLAGQTAFGDEFGDGRLKFAPHRCCARRDVPKGNGRAPPFYPWRLLNGNCQLCEVRAP